MPLGDAVIGRFYPIYYIKLSTVAHGAAGSVEVQEHFSKILHCAQDDSSDVIAANR